jgi:hypothetical protein
MGKQPTKQGAFIKNRFHAFLDVVWLAAVFLPLLTYAGGLILLFSGVAISTLWNGCRWRPRPMKERAAHSPRPAPPQLRFEEEAGESPGRSREVAGPWKIHAVVIPECDS